MALLTCIIGASALDNVLGAQARQLDMRLHSQQFWGRQSSHTRPLLSAYKPGTLPDQVTSDALDVNAACAHWRRGLSKRATATNASATSAGPAIAAIVFRRRLATGCATQASLTGRVRGRRICARGASASRTLAGALDIRRQASSTRPEYGTRHVSPARSGWSQIISRRMCARV